MIPDAPEGWEWSPDGPIPPARARGETYSGRERGLAELALEDTSKDEALIMYVEPESWVPLVLQLAYLWLKRHVFRRTL